MKQWPRYKTTASNQSASFNCPHCGVSAFEVLATERRVGDDASDYALIMQCMSCQKSFWRLVEADVFAETTAETAEPVLAGTEPETTNR